MDLDQTAPMGAVCSGSTLFASILNLSVMLGIYLQQTTSADDIFRCILSNGLTLHATFLCYILIHTKREEKTHNNSKKHTHDNLARDSPSHNIKRVQS